MTFRPFVATFALLLACHAQPADRASDAGVASGGDLDAAGAEHASADAEVRDGGLRDAGSPDDEGFDAGREDRDGQAAHARDGSAGEAGVRDANNDGGVAPSDAAVADAGKPPALRIATFNLENFGPTKASRPQDVAIYVAAIRRYDLVAIQEIQNKTGDAARALLEAVNAAEGPEYRMLLSDNTGREADDLTSQERYAYFYNSQVVTMVGGGELFDDAESDLFQREPFVARFVVRDWDFVLVTVHTRPQSAVAEIGALDTVITEARTTYGDNDVIALGDFNASCDYASPEDLDALALRAASEYLWIVPDDADTNVSTRACPPTAQRIASMHLSLKVLDNTKVVFRTRSG